MVKRSASARTSTCFVGSLLRCCPLALGIVVVVGLRHLDAPRRNCYVSAQYPIFKSFGQTSIFLLRTWRNEEVSRGRTFVAAARNLAMLPATILAHSLLRRLVSHIGWDLLSSGLTSGLVGRPLQQGTANLFRIATLQRRVAQFRSRERHVPN